MLEAAVWIGVILSGIAVLGVVEFVRSNSFFKAHGEDIKANLPIVGLILLLLITGSVAAVFFFLYFLASFWQFSLAVLFMVFVFLVSRIRKEQSMAALVTQPGPATGEGSAPPRLFTRVATLAVEAAGAALLMVFMVPLAAGGFLLFRFFGLMMELMGMGAANPVAPFFLLLATIILPYYLFIRRRQPPA